MAGDTEKSRLFTRRAILIGGAQTALFSLLAGRLYYLQIIEGAEYHELAEENRINVRLIAPPRGRILDRNGVPLALNDQTFRVVLLPEQVDNLGAVLDKLDDFIPIDAADRKRIARAFKDRNGLNAIVVRDDLTRDQMDRIAVHTPEMPGVDIDAGAVRAYPYGEATAHLLGYVGTVSQREIDSDDNDSGVLNVPGMCIGKNGVEKEYDVQMRGEAGDVEMEVNAHGRVVRELTRHDPTPGSDVTLTIDIGLQQFMQQRLAREEGAAAVILDIHSGAVLALASQPSFDPNLFTFGISQKDWDRLNNDIHAPLLDKVISGVYAPGSTIKPIVAMAALEGDIATPEQRVFCPGYYKFGGHTFHCWKHSGHGWVDMEEAITQSCDVYFYDLGRRTGIDRIKAMANRFGWGHRLGIDLPHERGGLVPSREWKMATLHQPWEQGETLIAAIGQGYMLATPLQLATMAARLCNGGRAVIPHVAEKIGGVPVESDATPDMGFDPSHLALIQKAMAAVTNSPQGTAYDARIERKGMEMGGKTGTAQVFHITEAERKKGILRNDQLPWKERDHALFAGFAPIGAPRFAVGVIVEHGGSGAHAAVPIARDTLIECQTRFKPKPVS
ncbi:MAG: penicillin-binding protein 2 [Alphaproteobacteria bacterium]|nr:penicillin-binding protein 2 [Alphaproteobacteria bacterium]